MTLFYKIFFNRILKFALFLQLVSLVSFTMLQMPHFLGIIKGVAFDTLSIVLMLFLRTLEWFNFLSIVGIISALLGVIGADFRQSNMSILLIQMGKQKKALIRPMLLLSLVYATSFILIEGFAIPKANYYLKQKLVEITKNRLINSIQPRNLIPYDNWNFTTLKRVNDTQLEGVLLNKESDPHITLLVGEVLFENKELIHLELKDGVGKVQHDKYKFVLRFDKGNFVGPSSMVRAHKNVRNLDFIQLFTNIKNHFRITKIRKAYIREVERRLWLAIVVLIVPFFAFTMLFGIGAEVLICCIMFLISLFYAVEIIIPFNYYIFCIALFSVYMFYIRRLKKELLQDKILYANDTPLEDSEVKKISMIKKLFSRLKGKDK